MIKGSSNRTPAWPVASLFVDRWSPRSMTGEPVSDQELMTLLEAARWAPSSMNFQPWRMLYARRDTAHWPTFIDLVSDRNRRWAERAAALVLFVSKTIFDADGRPCITHSFDAGAAWQSLALQGSLLNLVVHGIQGFDYQRARDTLQVPTEYHIDAMVVIGRPADPALLPPDLQSREKPSDRRPLQQTICEGPWSL